MPKFTVVKPIAVTIGEGEKALVKHYSRPGVEVELSDEVATPLVAAGRIEPTALPEMVEPVIGPPADPPAENQPPVGDLAGEPPSADSSAGESDSATDPPADVPPKPRGRQR